MKEPLISEAMGNIDAAYIEQAADHVPVVRKTQKRRVVWSAVACACLAVIIAVGAGWLWRGDEPGVEPPDDERPDDRPGAYVYAVGETFMSSYGTILYQAYEDGKITLIFDKTDEREVYWFLSGNDIKDEWLDEHGKPAYDLDHYYASNMPDYSEWGTRVADGVIFIVNGEETTLFPTAPGRYEIVIDYTKLFDLCTEMDPYIHGSIGAFYIGEYAYIDGNPTPDDPPKPPVFHLVTEYQSAGKRLVNPVIVTKEEFLLVYPIDVATLIDDKDSEIQYRFDCAMDPDTLETDRSTVVNGVITVINSEKVAEIFCISQDGPVIEYIFDHNNIQPSDIGGVEVELYDIVNKGGKSILYAIFKLDEYHITYTMNENNQSRMVTTLEQLIARYAPDKKS